MDPEVPQRYGKWAALVGAQLSLQWRAPRTSQLEYSQMLPLPTTQSSRCSLPKGSEDREPQLCSSYGKPGPALFPTCCGAFGSFLTSLCLTYKMERIMVLSSKGCAGIK